MKRFLMIVLKLFMFILKTVVCIVFTALTFTGIAALAISSGEREEGTGTKPVDHAIMDRYDMFVTNTLSNALDGVLSIKKVYWLSDDDLIAPEPNQNCDGESAPPSSLQSQGFLWF